MFSDHWHSQMAHLAGVLNEGIQNRDHFGGQFYISLGSKVILDEAFGYVGPKSVKPFPADALMLWRSSGKPLTAVALAFLVAAGKIDLHAPVADMIPEFGLHGKNRISAVHLLTHTGGIRNADKLSETLAWDEMISRICGMAPEEGWPLGERAAYHQAGSWYILAELCRRVAGVDNFSLWIRQQILEPLKMLHTHLGIPENLWDQTHQSLISPIFLSSTSEISPHPYLDSRASCCGCRPGGNARGPMRELGRFYEFLLQSESQRSLKIPDSILTPFLTHARPRGLFDETFHHQMDWGLGFMLNSAIYGKDSVPYGFGSFASDATFGHGGAQSSAGFADPVHQLVVCWAVNGLPGEIRHQYRVRKIHNAIYQDLDLARI